MFSTSVISKLGYLILSFIIGVLFFYVNNEGEKLNKKKQLEMIFSLLINFIIFMWIGKVILHFPLLFKDPIAVLAYPMNSYTFYIATFLLVINLVYLVIQKKEKLVDIFQTFLPIFLASLFAFEFVKLVIEHQSQQYLAFILQLCLLLIYLFYGNKNMSVKKIIFMIWIVGKFVISIISPYTMIFNIMISPYYFGSLLVLIIVINLYNGNRKVA